MTQYGAAFTGDYGWAAVELGRAKATFTDLEQHVGLEAMRRGYQRANSAVHGGALATLTRNSAGVHAGPRSDLPPAYGCELAVSYTLTSVSMLVATLCLDRDSTPSGVEILHSRSHLPRRSRPFLLWRCSSEPAAAAFRSR